MRRTPQQAPWIAARAQGLQEFPQFLVQRRTWRSRWRLRPPVGSATGLDPLGLFRSSCRSSAGAQLSRRFTARRSQDPRHLQSRVPFDFIEKFAIAHGHLGKQFPVEKRTRLHLVRRRGTSLRHLILLRSARRNAHGNSGKGTNGLTHLYKVALNGRYAPCSWFVQV